MILDLLYGCVNKNKILNTIKHQIGFFLTYSVSINDNLVVKQILKNRKTSKTKNNGIEIDVNDKIYLIEAKSLKLLTQYICFSIPGKLVSFPFFFASKILELYHIHVKPNYIDSDDDNDDDNDNDMTSLKRYSAKSFFLITKFWCMTNQLLFYCKMKLNLYNT